MSCNHKMVECLEPEYEDLYCEFCGMSESQVEYEELIASNPLDIRPIVARTLRIYGLTYREIGELLGTSKQTVQKLLEK